MSVPSTTQWIRQAVHRVGVGSGRLATHLVSRAVLAARGLWWRSTGWLREASGVAWLLRLALLLLLAALLRKIVTAVAVGVYERVEAGGAPLLLWGAAGLWVVAAYRCGRDGWQPKRSATPDEPADVEEPEPDGAEPPVGPRPPTAAELVAAVREIGTPHAHLKALALHLGTSTERVREAAAAAGLAVTDVRMNGRPSTGVRGDALPPLPSPAAGGGVVGAGQPTNNDNNNAEQAVREEGLRVEQIGLSGTVVHDPADVIRHHQVRGQ